MFKAICIDKDDQGYRATLRELDDSALRMCPRAP